MPELILKLGDNVIQNYVFDKDIISIGRSRDNDIVVENLSVSRNHARIRRNAEKFVLTDLNSSNGTFVNGVRISKTEIVDDDIISIGKHKISFHNRAVNDEDLIVEALGADRTMVVERAPTAVLAVAEGKNKGKEFSIQKTEVTIGKAANNDIVLTDDWFVAKRQALILNQGNNYVIEDVAGGLRKAKVNGANIPGRIALNNGDVIEIGSTRFVFSLVTDSVGDGRVPRELGLDDSVFSGVSDEPLVISIADPVAADAALGRHQTQTEEEINTFNAEASPVHIETRETIPSVVESEVEQRFDEAFAPDEVDDSPELADDAPLSSSEPENESATSDAEQSAEADEESQDMEEDLAHHVFPASDASVPTISGHEEDLEHFPPPPPAEASFVAEAAAPVSGDVLIRNIENAGVAQEIQLWEKALTNPSPIVRKQAAKMLKKLTGQDYAY